MVADLKDLQDLAAEMEARKKDLAALKQQAREESDMCLLLASACHWLQACTRQHMASSWLAGRGRLVQSGLGTLAAGNHGFFGLMPTLCVFVPVFRLANMCEPIVTFCA